MTCPPCSRRAGQPQRQLRHRRRGRRRPGMTGAALLAARAALKTGAGSSAGRLRRECFAPALRPVATRTDAARRPLAAGRQLERDDLGGGLRHRRLAAGRRSAGAPVCPARPGPAGAGRRWPEPAGARPGRAALGRWPGRADAASGRSGPAARPNDRPGTGRPAHRRPAAGWPLRRLDRAQGAGTIVCAPMAAGDATPAAIPAWRPPEPGTYWRACWDR